MPPSRTLSDRGILSAFLCMAAAACGGGSGTTAGGYILTLVGDPDVLLQPGEQREVQVLLTGRDVGPVAGAPVHFEFPDGAPPGARVDAADLQTDAHGIATASVIAGTSPGDAASYRLVASAPLAAAEPAEFSVHVVEGRAVLELVGDVAAQSGALTLGVSTSFALKVRELEETTGAPVAGDAIRFTLPPSGSSRWSSSLDRSIIVRTGAGGDAEAVLLTPLSAEAAFPIAVKSESRKAELTVTVIIHSAPPASCTASTQCGPAPASAEAPDVTGLWLTRHAFRVRDALPMPVKALADALRLIDQSIQGKLTVPGLPAWVDAVIRSLARTLLRQYLPGWARMVVSIGDDLFTVLSEFRAEGSMRVVRKPGSVDLEGSEVWTRLVFYWLPLCGGSIDGDPADPPDCARLEIATGERSSFASRAQCRRKPLPRVTVELPAFAAHLSGSGPYALHVGRRQANLEMGAIIVALLDEMLGRVTPYHCLDEMIECSPGRGKCPLLDCHHFGRDAERATHRIVPAATVEGICAAAVRSAGSGITELLANAWIPALDTLEFQGDASISGNAVESHCDPGSVRGSCAARLGSGAYGAALRHDPKHRDGAWEGAFLSNLVKTVPGAWEASRP